jgi:hypothetical protein
METINILNIPFYKFCADQALTDRILNQVSNYKFTNRDIALENGYSYPDFFDEELFLFFETSIKKVQNLYYHDNLEFPIVDCWVNKYSKMNNLVPHTHNNSVICGVFYLTSHEDEGATIFSLPNPWHNQNNSNLSIYKGSKPILGEIKAQAGTLVLFPNNLLHTMKTLVKVTSPRYTIAFNTFPRGTISDLYTTKLSLDVISVRERVIGLKAR